MEYWRVYPMKYEPVRKGPLRSREQVIAIRLIKRLLKIIQMIGSLGYWIESPRKDCLLSYAMKSQE